jgi:hypothetical protein
MKNIRLVATGALALVAFNPLPVLSQANASSEQQYVIAARPRNSKRKQVSSARKMTSSTH